MAKFKVGDRVRLLEDQDDLPAGSVGTVVEDDSVPYVEWDGFDGGHSIPFHDDRKSCWAVHEDEIKLLTPESETAAPTLSVISLLIAAGHVTQAQVDAARALLEAR